LGGDLFGAPEAKCDSFVAQSDRSVAPAVQPSITEKSNTAKLENTPKSPSLRDGDLGNLQATCVGVDDATDRVMLAIGATARRLRRKLRAVIVQRVELGEVAEEVADRMIDAWQRYSKQGLRLYSHMSAAEFFEGPYWLNSNTWNWNAAFIERERLQMEARVGS
jgi:hypothetical protein